MSAIEHQIHQILRNQIAIMHALETVATVHGEELRRGIEDTARLLRAVDESGPRSQRSTRHSVSIWR